MVRLPRYIGAEQLGYKDYVANTKEFNIQLQHVVKNALSESIGFSSRFCAVVVTGSDGRLEKGIGSRLEFIVLHPSTRGLSWMVSDIIMEQLNALNGYQDRKDHDTVEIKDTDNETMSYYKNDKTRVFPTRLLDSAQVFGDPKPMSIARFKLYEEFNSPAGSSILDAIKEKKRQYKIVSMQGVQKYNKDITIRHFDMEAGVCFYDPDSMRYSFKIGPLRFVQMAIMQDIISYCRKSDQEHGYRLLQDAPANMADKIAFLQTQGLLRINSSKAAELADCYNYLLWTYNHSQDRNHLNGHTKTEFDKHESSQRINIILDTLKQPLMK